MKCPHCDVSLLMSERKGVEIDYCPECRGVWLDRGELDKIVERSTAEVPAGPAGASPPAPPRLAPPRPADRRDDDRYEDRRYDDRRYEGYGSKKKKRKSFLEDIFDF